MNNIKTIYETFGRGKQQFILRQELLPILVRFDDVIEDTDKNQSYKLQEIFVDWLDTDVVRLKCIKEGDKNKQVIILVPFASIPAILLKRTDLSFNVIINSPLCIGSENGKYIQVATRVELKCTTEKRRYRLDTNFKDYLEKDNSDKQGCTYTYPLN